MDNSRSESGHDQQGRRPSALLTISLCANVVLAAVVMGLGIWGWDREKVAAAAIAERDEAYETSRNLQSGLINAKGMINGMADPLRPQPQAPDDDPAPPR